MLNQLAVRVEDQEIVLSFTDELKDWIADNARIIQCMVLVNCALHPT